MTERTGTIMSDKTRRDFLRITLATGALSLFFRSSDSLAVDKMSKPDILLIMPDQMRGDCLSALGHPVVRTPCLDELARQGTLFRRAYSTVPSCIPARYALLTGLYPQTSGVVGFKNKPFSTQSLPQLIALAGYLSVLAGRNMHQVPGDEKFGGKLNGYQKVVLGSTYVDDDDYDRFLKKYAPETGGIKSLVKKLGISYNQSSAEPWPLASNLHPTAWVVSESRKVVADTPPGQPLFLTTSFYAPHPPLFPPKQYFDACLERKLPPAAHGDWVEWGKLSPDGDKQGHRILLEGDPLRKVQAGYFGLIEHLDAEIVTLVADFKARSVKAGRPWLIVVTSDHGEMLGDHGYFRKCEPYEGSANIPFIIAGSPELDFKRDVICNQPVCLEDIMPTLLQAAGAVIPESIDGVNLVPVLRGEKSVIREWLHFEHAPCYSKEQAFHALTDGCFKYIWRPTDGTEQLFDLRSDPGETHNLSGDATARAVIEKWRSILVQRLKNRPEGFSDGFKLVPGREYKALNK